MPSLHPPAPAEWPVILLSGTEEDPSRWEKQIQVIAQTYVRNVSQAIAMQFTIWGPTDINAHSFLVPGVVRTLFFASAITAAFIKKSQGSELR